MATDKKSITITMYREELLKPFESRQQFWVAVYRADKCNAYLNAVQIPEDSLPEKIPSQIQVTIKFK